MSATTAFTAEQRDAIERRRGSLALAANAGSGKTSVLVERYVLAVTADAIAPGRILAITFTDRAAGELRERVRRRLVDAGERERAAAAHDRVALLGGERRRRAHRPCARQIAG